MVLLLPVPEVLGRAQGGRLARRILQTMPILQPDQKSSLLFMRPVQRHNDRLPGRDQPQGRAHHALGGAASALSRLSPASEGRSPIARLSGVKRVAYHGPRPMPFL